MKDLNIKTELFDDTHVNKDNYTFYPNKDPEVDNIHINDDLSVYISGYAILSKEQFQEIIRIYTLLNEG